MLVKDFITKEIPVLKSFDTVEYALGLMEDFKLKHLPLIVDTAYHSLISERELLEMDDISKPIGDHHLEAHSIMEDQHILEAMGIMTRYDLSMLPVLSQGGSYIGALTREKMVDAISELCGAEIDGALLLLDMMPQDYSLSEIARIVESNNAHVLALFSMRENSTGRMLITLKIDLEDASPVVRSFERFNYNIVSLFMRNGVIDDMLRQRMDEVIYYMNM